MRAPLVAGVLIAGLLREGAAFSPGAARLPAMMRGQAAGLSSRPPYAGRREAVMARRGGLRLAARGLRMQVQPAEEEPPAGVSPQVLFLAASSLTYAVIIGTAPEDSLAELVHGLPEAFLRNLPAAVFCFGGADIATQQIERNAGLAATESLDVRRVLSAVVVGIVCNAFGLAVWLHYLEGVVPFSSIGIDSAEGLGHLAAKSALHSWVWGTLGNTIALVGRRLLAGDSWGDSVGLWRDKIFPVTEKQLWFWPAWQAVNFAYVPDVWQAQFTGMGSFFFNVFMSWVAQSGQREAIAKARLEAEVWESSMQAEGQAKAAPQDERETAVGGGRK